jgi:hypothetical protein
MEIRPGLVLLIWLSTFPAARADDWPQWRGPNRDDVSKEKGLLKSWPKDGPKLLWTCTDAGIGYSGMAVVGNRLYSLGTDKDKEVAFALDVENGKKIWTTEMGGKPTLEMGDGPRGTPTIDGDLLFAIGGGGEFVCIKTGNGEKLWHLSLTNDLGGKLMSRWGYSESPLVDGDKVLCTPGGGKGTLAALDKKTGKVLWRSKEWTDDAGYSSIIPVTWNGVRQYVQMTGKGVAGVAADDGRLLWRYSHENRVAAIPTPVIKDNEVYISSGYGAGCDLVKVIPDGKGFRCEEVYGNDVLQNMINHHGGVVRVGDFLYGFSGDNARKPDEWICQEFKTGKVAWHEKKMEKGSITFADGCLYLYGEKTGAVVLLEDNSKEWKEAGRFTIPRKSAESKHKAIWTHPTVANGRLYLRDQELIFCYDVKESK